MASDKPQDKAEGDGDADFAKAYQELAKGERAATALENHLTQMEAKIEELLKQATKEQDDVKKAREARSSASENGTSS